MNPGGYRLLGMWVLLIGVLVVGFDAAMLSQPGSGEAYDLVLQGGRVIDPETGLDGVRNVGIRGDRIMEISERPLRGREVLDVSGLVVAPGFIDLHAHGQTNEANEYQAHDGVTTALELESGEDFLTEWLASRTGRALINFGATVPHAGVRWRAMDQYAAQADRMGRMVRESGLETDELAEVRRELGAVEGPGNVVFHDRLFDSVVLEGGSDAGNLDPAILELLSHGLSLVGRERGLHAVSVGGS